MKAVSPISDEALEATADRVAALLRRVRKRAPKEVVRRVRQALADAFDIVESGGDDVQSRLRTAKELEALEFELQGRDPGHVQFYSNGRLAIVRLYNPIRIRETVDHASCLEHVRRYEERVDRAQRRLHWFYKRAGLDVEAPAVKSWDLPYAAFEEVHELIWGKVRRM